MAYSRDKNQRGIAAFNTTLNLSMHIHIPIISYFWNFLQTCDLFLRRALCGTFSNEIQYTSADDKPSWDRMIIWSVYMA